MIDIEGFKLHSKYAYPAFASLKKYENVKEQILNFIKIGTGAENLLKLYAKHCPYLILYTKQPYSIKHVRRYWLGTNKTSHNSLKFRDWYLDDHLKLDKPTMRSVHCDLEELNKCSIHAAKLINNGAEILLYKMNKGEMRLEKSVVKFKRDFCEPKKYFTLHYGYAIEEISEQKAKTMREHMQNLTNAFNTKRLWEHVQIEKKFYQNFI